ncbi:YpdA family putative bacillithiol disulfide reductase [Algoriphagus halophytocola]|uniref:YpdA family putative bacillithiol disulfide reductase n=1 Tax=Algoriphagus halophytocola TaxID=2991499 RepID=A0ABY6MDY4_9BACT|nr:MULTISPECIES: YpdA family putative bacillithiol disulfide reductase [unclassified Algoriphagus]UZD21115.1 YpdA family putative bacillithiol disulfide reductase [Algoriphagus sp. TR-M5]WBL42283.1 YpdA family putative bacillithiol disulfide reductase [Algoriphagus sp. TR-M9]
MAEKIFDMLIIGGGPIGLACGVEAKKAGLDYLIVEKGALTNSIYNYPINMTFFSTSDRLEMADIPFMSIGNKPTRTEALEYYRRVFSHFQLNVKLYEAVEKLDKRGELFQVKTSKDEYLTKNIVLATGFYDLPNLMNIPGENLPKVHHYYKEPWPFINQKIVVVGGANSAVDAALECWRKGAEVSMVLLDEGVDQAVKYWVRPDIVNRIKEGSIRAFTKSKLKEIREQEVVIATPEGDVTIENDFVLAMTGYKPNFTLLNQLGVELSPDEKCQPVYNEITQESNVQGVYLAGVVCGGMNTREFFIENSIVHAESIVRDIVNKSHK